MPGSFNDFLRFGSQCTDRASMSGILVAPRVEDAVTLRRGLRTHIHSTSQEQTFWMTATWRDETQRLSYHSYLLGLLAMIKCSICSYQCDN